MSISLLSKSYGTSYANLRGVLRDAGGSPAQIYGSATSAVVNTSGSIVLSASGVLSVYVDDSKTFTLQLFQHGSSQVVLTDAGIEAGGSSSVNSAISQAEADVRYLSVEQLPLLNTSVGPYWEGRLLTNYAVAIYPPTTTAYPVVGTTLTVPSLNCLLNHTSNINANDSQIALVRVWPTALNDAQCGAAYKRYIRGWSAEVTPPLEFTFSSSGPSTNSGSDPSVVASLVGSPLFV